MLVKLTSSTTVEIVQEGHSLPYQPRWEVRDRSILVGPYKSGEEHEHHVVSETVGSGNWYKSEFDEFRFDKTDLLLRSIWLQVPEKNIAENPIKSWMEKIPIVGALRLSESEYFAPEPTDLRWFDPEGNLLVCIYNYALAEFKDRIRLCIATDVELIFGDNQLCGWILSQPLHYVTQGWEDPHLANEDSEVKSIASKYLQLVSEDFIEQMEDEDPDVLQDLLDIKNKSRNTSNLSYQRKVFAECIESIINQFYGELVAS
jgi:hypothetical protein